LDEYGVPTDASVPLTEATFTIDGTYAASHYLLELVAIDEEADTGDGGGGGDGAGTTEAPGADPDLKATLDEEEKGGCGCSSTRSAHGWWPLLALLPLLVRRRRT
jgi:MYXO-CTERM domain-containing protein